MPTGVYGAVAGTGAGHSVGRQGFLFVVSMLMGEWGGGGHAEAGVEGRSGQGCLCWK